MKYPFINSLVPEGEHFDETAVGEGIWLSATHLNAMEQNLANSAALNNANAETITALQTDIQAKDDIIVGHEVTIVANNTRIAELEAENAKMGSQPSGNGSTLVVAQDESAEKKPAPAYLSDNDPANQWFDRQMKHRKKP